MDEILLANCNLIIFWDPIATKLFKKSFRKHDYELKRYYRCLMKCETKSKKKDTINLILNKYRDFDVYLIKTEYLRDFLQNILGGKTEQYLEC